MTDFAADIFVPLCICFIVWLWFWTAKQQRVIGGGSTAQHSGRHTARFWVQFPGLCTSCMVSLPVLLLQPRAVCTGQTGHSTPSSRCQCGGSLVPRSWNSAFKLKTASLQHGQCRKLKLVDLISTPNIIRQHLSLTIQMNHFPDTKYVFFLTVLPSLLLRLLYSSEGCELYSLCVQ